MEALGAGDLLALWERGSGASVHERALLLLGAARPDLPSTRLGAVPIVARDAELLRLRRETFGNRLQATVACPSCGEALELDIRGDAIQGDAHADTAYPPIEVAIGGRTYAVRLPTTDDLIEAGRNDATDDSRVPDARRALVERLLLDGSDGAGHPAAQDDAPAADLEAAVAEVLQRAESDLELAIGVTCPSCGVEWDADLDVADFLWTEVLAGARRIADEVAGLAAAYGWREADALALSPWRRRLYLDLAAG